MAFRNKSVSSHDFAMIPRSDVPRSSFRMEKVLKTSFDCGWLVPVFCEEILPGDTFTVNMTSFCRLATPIFPFMDNLHLESFFFFVPNRLVWPRWAQFMGEQVQPGASTDYLIPQVTSPVGGWPIGSLADYFGLPTVGQVDLINVVTHSSLPLRAYNLIWYQWFRDENLVGAPPLAFTDGPDDPDDFFLLKRGKRPDYFTTCLPFTQKGPSVPLPLTGTAPVIASSSGSAPTFKFGGAPGTDLGILVANPGGDVYVGAPPVDQQGLQWNVPGLVADLGAATAATINSIRTAFQVQRLLERDARGGTRYVELVRAHFGVVSPDARLNRPEYLGGGHTPVSINPVAQTAATDATSPQGNLAAFGTAVARGHGFTQSFTEHGYVIGLICVRADLTYQQGLRRHWSRKTRVDFYFPAFAHLSEQAVLNKEIFISGTTAVDEAVFGYQERWAELRYNPSEITGLMRSTAAGTLDAWHLAQRFASVPALNGEFISEDPPLERVLAVGEAAGGMQFIGDFFFETRAARPLPMYSVPGLVDHF